MTLALWLACSSPDLPPPPGEGGELSAGDTAALTDSEALEGDTEDPDTDSPPDSPSDTAPDTNSTPPQDEPASCPAEMSAIRDGEGGEILYCIDTWEARASGKLGVADQITDGPSATATATSEPGVTPDTKLSFGQAKVVCENTPIYDQSGKITGYKRLPTSSEWFDAADGVVGEGGSLYVFGDEFLPGVCACQNEDYSSPYTELQPTGSLKECVSAFGLFDQSGNAWEWVDPQQTIDISRWWELIREVKPELDTDKEGFLYLPSGDLSGLTIEVAGVTTTTLRQGDGGYLEVEIELKLWDYETSYPAGYLEITDVGMGDVYSTEQYLPIEIIPIDPKTLTGGARLRVMEERDGHPFAEKVGGAYYNTYDACQVVPKGYYTHLHDFSGTIGFRCAADPVPGL